MISQLFHKCWITRALNLLAAAPGHSLVVLPATRRSLELVRRLSASRPCLITRARLFENLPANDPILACLRTPAEIMRWSAQSASLPRTVVSIPEQIVGNGPSFELFDFAGTATFFSMLESALMLRHAPPTFVARSILRGLAYRLDRFDAQSAGSEAPHTLQARLLAHLDDEHQARWPDWRGGKCLAAKTPAGYEASKREHYRDLEAILRLLTRDGDARTASGPLTMLRAFLDQSADVTSAPPSSH
ncbi:MAG: hypothetical protein IPK97_03835 [Ahniella sp.]|nr:hypothetical protein [Ahniella sp.]